jgi:hypothetical protein
MPDKIGEDSSGKRRESALVCLEPSPSAEQQAIRSGGTRGTGAFPYASDPLGVHVADIGGRAAQSALCSPPAPIFFPEMRRCKLDTRYGARETERRERSRRYKRSGDPKDKVEMLNRWSLGDKTIDFA